VTWTTYIDTNVNGGVAAGASTVLQCLVHCYGNAGCTAVDWNPTAAVGFRCWRHGSWSQDTMNRRTGVQHFVISRPVCS